LQDFRAPVDPARQFAPFEEVVNGLRGMMRTDDRLDQLREVGETPRDPFA
jgi:hypothetical protein